MFVSSAWEDRAGGSVGHSKYKCNVCMQSAPDPKLGPVFLHPFCHYMWSATSTQEVHADAFRVKAPKRGRVFERKAPVVDVERQKWTWKISSRTLASRNAPISTHPPAAWQPKALLWEVPIEDVVTPWRRTSPCCSGLGGVGISVYMTSCEQLMSLVFTCYKCLTIQNYYKWLNALHFCRWNQKTSQLRAAKRCHPFKSFRLESSLSSPGHGFNVQIQPTTGKFIALPALYLFGAKPLSQFLEMEWCYWIFSLSSFYLSDFSCHLLSS